MKRPSLKLLGSLRIIY